jgi:ATP-dependent 26S proteasome regulatory subunit
LDALEKKQKAQDEKLEKTSKAMFSEMKKNNEKQNQTNKELKEMQEQMSNMATQGWMLSTFGELLSVTKHIKSQFSIQENNGSHHSDNMLIFE